MNFDIIYTDRALNDLRNIYSYISLELLAPDTAKHISEKIMNEIDKLDTMPNRNQLYEKEPWRTRGLRKLIVDNFIAFYLTMEKQKQVLIVTIMYAKRNISEILDKLKI